MEINISRNIYVLLPFSDGGNCSELWKAHVLVVIFGKDKEMTLESSFLLLLLLSVLVIVSLSIVKFHYYCYHYRAFQGLYTNKQRSVNCKTRKRLHLLHDYIPPPFLMYFNWLIILHFYSKSVLLIFIFKLRHFSALKKVCRWCVYSEKLLYDEFFKSGKE